MERFALLLSTRRFSPADLNDNYRGELHQATDGGNRALNKDETGSSRAMRNLAGLIPTGSQERLQLRSPEQLPKTEVTGAVSAWTTEERPSEFPLYSLPVTFLCTLGFILFSPFFYFAISYLKISKQNLWFSIEDNSPE